MKNGTYYEVLWYSLKFSAFSGQKDEVYEFKSFKTRKQALDFYNEHKLDPDKFNWWVTKRDKDGYVIEDIIY